MRRISCFLFVAFLFALLGACDDESNGGSGPGNGAAAGTGGGIGGGDGGSAGMGGDVQPSGYLLISAERLEELQQAAADGAPDWLALKTLVDGNLGEHNEWEGSPENRALVYLLSGDTKYSDSAYGWMAEIIAADDVANDSYLYFGDRMRQAALVLNYCYAALSQTQRDALMSYLDRWVNELWHDNQGSGWGLDDPGNNYHHAFLEGTAFAGYALDVAGHPSAPGYIDLLHDKLQRQGGVLEYLDTRVSGGDWHEGTNYGQRTKQRLFAAMSVIVSMGGPNYFYDITFPSRSITYAVYQLQPDLQSLYPAGDMAWVSDMLASPYDRDYIQTATFWAFNSDMRGHAQWYLDSVVPTYDESGFRGAVHKDLLYRLDLQAEAPDALPTHYRAEGTEWVNVRSGWDTGATSVSISGTPLIDQSHAHHDVGSFTIFKGQWLAVDAVTYCQSGLTWSSDAHNMVHVNGAEREYGAVPGLQHFFDDGTFSYVQVDASGLYIHRPSGTNETMLNELTRELVYLRPNTLVVYDRVDPKAAGSDYNWRMHFPAQPSDVGGRFELTTGSSGISLVQLVGGTASIYADDDLTDDSSDAFRVEQAPTSTVSRYLNVVEVASGAAPSLSASLVTTSGAMEGALWQDQVVLFSSDPRGASAALPWSYTVSGTQARTHTLANMTGSVDATVVKQGGNTTVTIAAGSSHAANPAGVVRFTE